MAHVTLQREGAIEAPEQQKLLSTSEISAEPAAGTRALLLPVDDTDESEHACSWAASNICRKGAWTFMLDSPLSEHENGVSVQPGLVYAGDVVHLLHVVPEPSMIHVWPGMYVPPDDNAEQEEVHVAVAGTETDHLAKLINEKAEEVDAACVIMASHGKTSFQEFWAGSTSTNTTHTSSRPICIIPPAVTKQSQ
ncbi:TPA: hypothetical protein ACH3X3_010973 [Trebouxia sp. C0006]